MDMGGGAPNGWTATAVLEDLPLSDAAIVGSHINAQYGSNCRIPL